MPAKMELMIMRADGTPAEAAHVQRSCELRAYFHPNGRQIIFASNMYDPRGGNFDLF